jgi:hypothetical protein
MWSYSGRQEFGHIQGGKNKNIATLKLAAWVAETCWWLLCDKFTFIHSSAFVGVFKSFMFPINAQDMEHVGETNDKLYILCLEVLPSVQILLEKCRSSFDIV